MLPKGPAARLRAQEKWSSRARITETSFTFLEAQTDEEEQEAEKEKRDIMTEVARNGDDWRFLRPETETTSSFRLDAFRSLLLPDNNRPLEQSVLHSLKELFAHTDANTTALHMLSVDCQVTPHMRERTHTHTLVSTPSTNLLSLHPSKHALALHFHHNKISSPIYF